MERAISEMERIKRAEEIYSKRRNNDEISKNEMRTKNIYKNLFQFLLLINIAIIVVAFQNREYIFSEEFIKQVNSYNINVKEKIEEFTSGSSKEDENIDNKNEASNTNITNNANTVSSTSENVSEKAEQASQVTEKQQGALVENEAKVELSQMELDAKAILENYSIILPVNGTKTSGFGERESTNPIVTPNHTGVDIAAVTGTPIKAAHSGIVTQVSKEGDYGEHLRITIDNLTTLYAHCSKIYVTEGQEVKQGDLVAEVRKYRKFNWSTFAFWN